MINYFQTVRKLAAVLKIIDITTFFYIRIYRNNQFFVLSNNKDISDHLTSETCNIGSQLSELLKTSICGKISISLWPNFPNDTFLQRIYQLGIWNGISVALPFNDYIDIFSFASSIENTKINNFYLNYLRLIKRFIIYFRLKGKKVIESASHNLYSLAEKVELYSLAQQQEKIIAAKNLREMVPPRKAFIKATYLKKILLTKRETEYLVLLLEGKSMHDISEELHVSQRSVESCLETIKSKTGYSTKIELLAAFLDSQIYQPSINYDRYN